MKSKYEYLVRISDLTIISGVKKLKSVKQVHLIKKNLYSIITNGKYLKNRKGLEIIKSVPFESKKDHKINWSKIGQIGISIGGILMSFL